MLKLAFAVLLVTAPAAFAQALQYRYYDQNGIYQGSGQRDGNRFVYRGANGITQGWDRLDGNQIRHYNANGIYKGSTQLQR
jgi:hypothetical protein